MDDKLRNKSILWLGSSVTYGSGAGGYSMVEYIAEQHPQCQSLKNAVSGTTLVEDGTAEDSYIARLRQIPVEEWKDKLDLVVVQLSTNDATQGKPYGTLSDMKSLAPEAVDETTIIGAIEYIIRYVRTYLHAEVAFYTGTYYESEAYAFMVEALKEIAARYQINIINLWDNPEMRALYGTEQYRSYMPEDGIHPNKKGYQEWWGPVIDRALTDISL